MAEARPAGAEEADELHLPPFDAEAYVRKEVRGARATVVLGIYGLLLGQVGAILAVSFRNPVASLGALLLGLTALKGVLELTGVAHREWKRRDWAGHVLVVLFTWLAAWVLFTNQPFVA